MQEDFGSLITYKGPPAERMPDQVFCVVKVYAAFNSILYENPQPSPLRKAFRRLLGKPCGKMRLATVNQSYGKNETFALDYSVIPLVLDQVAAFRKNLDDVLTWKNTPGWESETVSRTVEIRIGRREDFEPRSSDPTKLWALSSGNSFCLPGDDATAQKIAEVLNRYYTPETHERAAMAEQERIRALGEAVEAAVVLESPIPVKRSLQLKKPGNPCH
jgi:hypothetical protein